MAQPVADSLPTVSPSTVKEHINSINPKKAPGDDGIPAKALQNFTRKPLVALTNIINASRRFQHFPNSWKNAIIIIRKKMDVATVPQNYRPISLLPFLAKVLEKVIKDILLQEIEEKGMIQEVRI